MTYYPKQTHVIPLATILRERRLPVPGEVLVRQGASVVAADVVARAAVSTHHAVLDVASRLGISAARVDDFLVVDRGQKVEAGQVLAERRRFLRKVRVTAPVEGVIALVEDGRVVLEAEPEVIELRAAMGGVVAAITPRYGVQIQTVGALIQGVWGNGGVQTGPLRVVSAAESGELPASAINLDHGGAIIVSRVAIGEEALSAAVEQRVRGVVAPSMRASLVPVVKALEGTSLVLTEGFGARPMSDVVFKLLREHEGREAVLIGAEPGRWQSGRPEVIVPLLSHTQMAAIPRVGEPVRVGNRVRLLREPHRGLVGVVTALPDAPMPVDSGIKALGAQVDAGEEQTVFVPFANLELLG